MEWVCISLTPLKYHTFLEIAMIFLAIPSVAGAQAASRASGASTSTTICAFLANPARFDQKRVRFRAKYGGTWEGMWLSDDACDGVGELILPEDSDIAVAYGVSTLAKRAQPLVRDAAWKKFESLSHNLSNGLEVAQEGVSPASKYLYLTADFEGVVVIKRNFHFKNGFGNGWGHLRASRFLLILRSVSDISAQALDPVTTH